jgi:hypothetical protein
MLVDLIASLDLLALLKFKWVDEDSPYANLAFQSANMPSP